MAGVAAASAPVVAAAWMVLSMAGYVSTVSLAKHLSDHYGTFELVFLRGIAALVFIAPMLVARARRSGRAALFTKNLPMQLLRAVFTTLGMGCWFYAASVTTLSKVSALQFLTPLFAITGASLILKEKSGPATWVCVLVGFLGAMIILRPGMIDIGVGAAAALGAAFFYACVPLTVRVLSRTDSATTIVLYVNVLVLPVSLIPALAHWSPVRVEDLPWFFAIGLAGFVGQYAGARAVGGADARVVQPFQFTRLIIAATIGLIFFGEALDLWDIVGALVIFSASYAIIYRENRAAAA